MFCAEDGASRRQRAGDDTWDCLDRYVVNPAGACLHHGSFVIPNSGRWAASDVFRFAFVRDPLDRFLSTFRPVEGRSGSAARYGRYRGYDPHGSWQRCRATECKGEINDLKAIAATLEADLHRWSAGTHVAEQGLLTHALTQMYFLTGTDADGTPLKLSYVGRLENFTRDWEYVRVRIGAQGVPTKGVPTQSSRFNAERMNIGGVPAAVRAAAEREPAIVCPLCRIYMQDYQCLGYARPLLCVQNGGTACRRSPTTRSARLRDVLSRLTARWLGGRL